MLKITTRREAASMTLVLEGKLVRPWVQELEHCWHAVLASQQAQTVRVDLTAVTFIDAAGKTLLTLMTAHGTELVAGGCMTTAIVEDITRGQRQPTDSSLPTGRPRRRRGNVGDG